MLPHIEPITSEKIWETFISTYSAVSLFQSWPWGLVEEKAGNRVWRLGVYQGKELVGVALVVRVSAKRGSFLHVRHGPVFSRERPEFLRSLFQYLEELARNEHVWFIRISPLLVKRDLLTPHFFRDFSLIPSEIHAMNAELCWVLDLGPDEETLLSGMRKTTRYEIKKAQKLGVKVTVTSDSDELQEFFKLYKITSMRHHFVGHTGILPEFQVFSSRDQAVLLLGEHEGQVLASAIVLFYGGQAIYHHGASVKNTVGASYLVQWRAIQEAKRRGMNVYNFWGIAPDDKLRHPWRGITLFKKGFGGREIEYIHAHDLPVSPLYAIPRAVEWFRRVRKGY
ncbi:MAG: peptidoglycan bridge formation glycyltransferase FemA/FemB family protein [bacterium]|nr:peptidoglycan bridge formation glycyltransferase FemA/FemB family protein [bacterium]